MEEVLTPTDAKDMSHCLRPLLLIAFAPHVRFVCGPRISLQIMMTKNQASPCTADAGRLAHPTLLQLRKQNTRCVYETSHELCKSIVQWGPKRNAQAVDYLDLVLGKTLPAVCRDSTHHQIAGRHPLQATYVTSALEMLLCWPTQVAHLASQIASVA